MIFECPHFTFILDKIHGRPNVSSPNKIQAR